MPRQPRVVIPGRPHHITQRGNGQRDVFYTEVDRSVYISLLKKYTAEYAVQVLGFCLMTNHVHVIATPATAAGLTQAFGRTHNDYSRWLHVHRRESGHLWQSRYFSCPLDGPYIWAALAYVERNPVRAGLVAHCEDWHWSSAQFHLGRASSDWLTTDFWAQNWTTGMWRSWLEKGFAEDEIRGRLLEATRTGRPLGEAGFVETCEQQSGRLLRPKRSGPKPKSGYATSAN